VNKAKDYFELKDNAKLKEDYFFIKCESRYEKILFDELLYVEALQNYVVLHTTNKRYVSYLTFKSVEDYLPTNRFLKVQKSFIVSLSKIDSIDGTEIKIGSQSVNISRNNKEEILEIILKNKLLKR
jgi:DNA-binding LytR/AlgR family response regulator